MSDLLLERAQDRQRGVILRSAGRFLRSDHVAESGDLDRTPAISKTLAVLDSASKSSSAAGVNVRSRSPHRVVRFSVAIDCSNAGCGSNVDAVGRLGDAKSSARDRNASARRSRLRSDRAPARCRRRWSSHGEPWSTAASPPIEHVVDLVFAERLGRGTQDRAAQASADAAS